MKSRPILFSGPMVRAILNGSKTQTRRIFKARCDCGEGFLENCAMSPEGWQIEGHSGLWACGCCGPNDPIKCPYGQPGDRLWVRETARLHLTSDECAIQYQADMAIMDLPDDWYSDDPVLHRWAQSQGDNPKAWRPSILVPRKASRITLEIEAVRVERLQDISPADCDAEGIEKSTRHTIDGAGRVARINDYCDLWSSINGVGSWAENPWVWVVQFRIIP